MGALNLDPVIKSVLKSHGINQDKIWEDLGSFILPAIADRSSAELGKLKGNLNKKLNDFYLALNIDPTNSLKKNFSQYITIFKIVYLNLKIIYYKHRILNN